MVQLITTPPCFCGIKVIQLEGVYGLWFMAYSLWFMVYGLWSMVSQYGGVQ